MATIEIESPNVTYSECYIEADYDYATTHVEHVAGKYKVCELVDGRHFEYFQ